MEYNYDWFANDLEEPYTTPDDKPFSWQGRTARRRRAHQRLGPPELPPQRAGPQGASRSTATATTGRSATTTSRPTTTSSRTTSASRGRPKACAELPDGKFHAADADDLRGDAAAHARQGRSSAAPSRSAARPTSRKPINGRARVPLLRPVRARAASRTRTSTPRSRPSPTRSKTGNCTLITERDGLQGADGPGHEHAPRACSTSTAITREAKEVRARVVVLCAQALESTRILLNSATREYPNGLANSSGVLGHYLMDHLWVGRRRARRVPATGRSKPSRRAAATGRTAST